MSAVRDLYRQSTGYFAGVWGAMALGFVSFPIFTRLLPVAEYGIFNLVMKTLLLVAVVAKMGLLYSVVRFYEEQRVSPHAAGLPKFYSTLYLSLAATAGLAGLVVALGARFAPETLISPEVRRPLMLGAAAIVTVVISQLLMAFFRAAGRSGAYATVQVSVKLGVLLVSPCLLLLWERSAVALITGTIAVEAVTVALLSIPLFRRGLVRVENFDRDLFRQMLAFGLPLLLFEFSSVLHSAGDRFLIQYFLGPVPLGLYAAAYNVSTYCQELIQSPLNLTLVPAYVRLWTTEGPAATQALLTRVLNDFLMVAFLVWGGVFVCSADAIVLLASRKYQDSAHMVPPLVAGLLLYTTVTFFYPSLFLHKKTWTMGLLVVGASVCNIVTNLLLIPRIGIRGAMVATVVSYAFLLAMAVAVSRRYLPLQVYWASCARCLLAMAAGIGAASLIHSPRPLLNLAARGLAMTAVYGSLLWLMERRFRTLLTSGAQEARRLLARS
jgi:O-antigen/teichoic acid export membrane protein